MITTKKIKLSPTELFKILMIRYVKKRWWLLLWIWVLAIILALQESYDSFTYFFIGFAVLFPILMIIYLWRYVNSDDNKLMFHERYYEIDKEKINGILDSETFSPIKIEHFIKSDLIKNIYLLYVGKDQFIYIPIDSFENEQDRNWFENEIIGQIKK
jgi:hypothetical protein